MNNILSAFGRFFRTVLRSCYDMELYREVRTRPWGRALGYFVLFSVFIVAVALVDMVPSSWSALKQARQYVADKVPAGASISIKAGKMETNLPSPTDLGNDQLAVIIDPSVAGLDADPAIRSKAGFLLGRDVIVIKDSDKEKRALSLSEMPDVAVTKESALAWIDRSSPWLVAAAAAAFAVIYLLASLSGGVMFVLLASAIAALFGAMWKARLRFGQWVAVGFHAVTLPTLANALFDVFRLNVPWVFTFLYFMVIVAVIADERAAPTSPPETAAAAVLPPLTGPAVPPPASGEEPAAVRPVAGPAKSKPAKKPAAPRARKKSPPPPAEPPAAAPPSGA